MAESPAEAVPLTSGIQKAEMLPFIVFERQNAGPSRRCRDEILTADQRSDEIELCILNGGLISRIQDIYC
jgi:hypothetical protein